MLRSPYCMRETLAEMRALDLKRKRVLAQKVYYDKRSLLCLGVQCILSASWQFPRDVLKIDSILHSRMYMHGNRFNSPCKYLTHVVKYTRLSKVQADYLVRQRLHVGKEERWCPSIFRSFKDKSSTILFRLFVAYSFAFQPTHILLHIEHDLFYFLLLWKYTNAVWLFLTADTFTKNGLLFYWKPFRKVEIENLNHNHFIS